MTISSLTNRSDYTGNDSTGNYNYTFKIFTSADISVTVREISTDIETTLAIDTDYTVASVGAESGGVLTLVDNSQAWIGTSNNLDSTHLLTLKRVASLKQETDIRNQGQFFPEVIEDAFDRTIMISQQQQDDIDGAMSLPITVIPSSFDTTIPAGIVGEDGVTIITNPAGNAFVVGPTASAITGASASAIAAAASETAAGLSEVASDASETAAAASAAASALSATTSQWNDVSYKVFANSPIAPVDGDSGTLFAIDCTNGNVVINLPSIAALSLGSAWSVGFKKTDSSSNTLTINRDGTDTIDGNTSLLIEEQYAGASLIPDIDGSPDDWTSLLFGSVSAPDSVVSKTTTYAATIGDNNVLADTSGGAWTLTLYAAATNTGRRITVKKTTTDANILTIDANASETIDGSTTYLVGDEDEFVELVCDGTNWQVVSKDIGKGAEQIANTFSAYGSTDTKIMRMTTSESSVGGSITRTSTAANGDTYDINVDGRFEISYLASASNAGAMMIGVSLNSSALTTDINGITLADRKALFTNNTVDFQIHTITCTLNLVAGDIVRPHTNAFTIWNNNIKFSVVRVG